MYEATAQWQLRRSYSQVSALAQTQIPSIDIEATSDTNSHGRQPELLKHRLLARQGRLAGAIWPDENATRGSQQHTVLKQARARPRSRALACGANRIRRRWRMILTFGELPGSPDRGCQGSLSPKWRVRALGEGWRAWWLKSC